MPETESEVHTHKVKWKPTEQHPAKSNGEKILQQYKKKKRNWAFVGLRKIRIIRTYIEQENKWTPGTVPLRDFFYILSHLTAQFRPIKSIELQTNFTKSRHLSLNSLHIVQTSLSFFVEKEVSQFNQSGEQLNRFYRVTLIDYFKPFIGLSVTNLKAWQQKSSTLVFFVFCSPFQILG